MKLKTIGNTIYYRNRQIKLDFFIGSAYKIMNKIIVRFDVTKDIINKSDFHNIICINLYGGMIWEAELPSNENKTLYYDIYKYWPRIIAHSLNYDCEIDAETGKIIRKKWIK